MSQIQKHELVLRRTSDQLHDLAKGLCMHGWTYPISRDFQQLVQGLREVLVDIKLEQPKR